MYISHYWVDNLSVLYIFCIPIGNVICRFSVVKVQSLEEIWYQDIYISPPSHKPRSRSPASGLLNHKSGITKIYMQPKIIIEKQEKGNK